MRLDEILTPPSASSGTPSAVKSYLSPSSASRATSPAARCPKRKFSPTATRAVCSRSTSTERTNSSGVSCENSRVKGIMQTTSAPSSASSSARRGAVHSRNGCEPGLITSDGCGSNVITTEGSPSPRAASTARPMMRWWPRCTPSKTPMVTTDRPQSAGTSARPCHRYTTPPSLGTPGGAHDAGPLGVLPPPKPATPPGMGASAVSGHEHGQRPGPAGPLLDQRDQGAVRGQRGHRAGRARPVQAGPVRQGLRLGLRQRPDRERGRRRLRQRDDLELLSELGQPAGGVQPVGPDPG